MTCFIFVFLSSVLFTVWGNDRHHFCTFQRNNGIIRIRKSFVLVAFFDQLEVYWIINKKGNIGRLSGVCDDQLLYVNVVFESANEAVLSFCPSRGGKIQPDGIKLILDLNKASLCLLLHIHVLLCTTSQFVFSSLMGFFFFLDLSVWLQMSIAFKPGQMALVEQNLSTYISYSWHCCLLPACLTRARCNERLMLNSEPKMKLQGNKHEWVSGKAIWLKESVK